MTDATTPLRVYNSLGDTISEDDRLTASLIIINNILDGIDGANFQLDDSTEGLDKGDDICITTDSGLRIFVGQVNWIDLREPRTAYCLGMLDRMNWYIVEESNSKTIQDEGVVGGLNGDHTIQCDPVNADEDPIAFSADQYNYPPATGSYYYLLVSDTTQESDSLECENAAFGYIGYGQTPDGFDHFHNNYQAVEKGTSGSGTHWEGHGIITSNATGYLGMHLEVEHEEIVKAASITKIVIDGLISVTATPATTPKSFKIGWALSAVDSYAALVERKCYIRNHTFPMGASTITIPFHNVLLCPNDTVTQRFFEIGEDYWAGGHFGIFYQINFGDFATFEVKWQAAQVTIFYETDTFDAMNHLITDTVAPNELTTAADYATAGVAVNDHWVIGIDYAVAFSQCFSAASPTTVPDIHYEINGGTAIGLGVAQNFYGSTGYDMEEALREQRNYHVWMDANDDRLLKIGPASIMPDGGTAPTPDFESNVTIEHGPVANVAIIYKNGMIIKATEVAGAVGLIKVQRESILTKEEAEALCDELVTEYSTTHYAVYAHYTKFPTVGASDFLEVGHTYDITVDGVLYEDQPLRRIEWRNDGGTGTYEVLAWFGLASTPSEERMAQELGKLRKTLRLQKESFMSSTYAPITRHDSLNGISGAGTAHLAAATATALEGDTYDADKLDGNHAAAFETAGTCIAKSFLDAKGNLITATANDTPKILPVGADGTFLKALAAAADGTGLEWAAGGGGGHTDEEIADLVGAMVSGNTETGITVTYQDADNTLDFEITKGNLTGTAPVTLSAAREVIGGAAAISIVNNAGAPAAITAIDIDGTLATNSDTLIPTQKAVKTYADTKVTAAQALAACVETEAYAAGWSGETKAPSKDDIYDKLQAMGKTWVFFDDDKDRYDWTGWSATNLDSVTLDLVNGDSEGKDAGITETNSITTAPSHVIPAAATEVLLKVGCKSTTVNVANCINVRKEGHNNKYQDAEIYGGAVANYINFAEFVIKVDANDKILVVFTRSAGNVYCYLQIIGYAIPTAV